MSVRSAISLFVAIAVSSSSQSYAQERERLIHVVSTAEFLRLSDSIQSVFVGGLLEGMAFAAYGIGWPDYPKWVECVRARTLAETTREVVAFLKQDTGFQEGVASALAQTLGKRCKKQ